MKGLVFTYLLVYGGTLTSIFKPFVGLLVYICLAILRPAAVWSWSVPQGSYSLTVALGLLIGWALHGFGRWNLGRGGASIISLSAFFFWTILSASQAPNQEMAWSFVDAFWKILLPIVVGATLLNSVEQLKTLAWVILLSQAYPALELNITYLQGYNQLRFDGFASMDNNSYAISLVTCSGIGIFLAMHSEKRWQRLLATFSVAVIAHAVLISFSRGGMLGLTVVGLTTFAVIPKGWKEYSGAAVAIILAVVLTGPEVRARFSTTFAEKDVRDASAQSRIDLWIACWDTIQKNPLLGVGPDHMPLYIHEYGFEPLKESHTLWLQIGAEVGVPGLIFLLSYYLLTMRRLFPLAFGDATTDVWLCYLARMVITSLCGFMLSAQFVSLEFLESPYYVCLLGAGVLKVASLRPGGLQCASDAKGAPSLHRINRPR